MQMIFICVYITNYFHFFTMFTMFYVQHEKCLPSVTKNYELYYSLKIVN